MQCIRADMNTSLFYQYEWVKDIICLCKCYCFNKRPKTYPKKASCHLIGYGRFVTGHNNVLK